MEESPISSPKPEMSRKRRRPGNGKSKVTDIVHSNKINVGEGAEEEREVLTPHTLRLLKLIQEGSAEHAQLAAAHLSSISSQSSPVALWEILGRLQFFLNSADWRTRSNASIAMEGVAQHLPVWDQRSFLQDTRILEQQQQQQQNDTHDQKRQQKEHVWLTLSDLIQGKMEVILEKGRTLLAYPEQVYDGDDEQLEKLDMDLKGSKQFCEQRLQLQRKILARRLGLSNVMSYYNGKDVVDQVLSGVDDMDENKALVPKKKIKRNELSLQNSLRALLVLEIRQQSDAYASTRQNVLSHRNSQMLLAGELVYRMFDASWHIRHGSLMGILALIRAWKVHTSTDTFGIWPHDILARSLCILGLDRFADYSGVTMGSTGGAVSPVREMAGQVFSVIFPIAPSNIQKESFDILKYLAKNSDWEVRHGALIAMKYCVALICRTSKSHLLPIQQSIVNEASSLAAIALEDESDDAQSVAAQLLSSAYVATTKFSLQDTTLPLWRSIEAASHVSSSVKDLVKLFASLVSRDCEGVLKALGGEDSIWDSCHRILSVLDNLLGCEYISVKCSILKTIGTLVNNLPTASCPNESKGGKIAEASMAFSKIVFNVFELYVNQFVFTEATEGNNSELDNLLTIWNESWDLLIKASRNILLLPPDYRSSLEVELLVLYFAGDGMISRKGDSLLRYPTAYKASHGHHLKMRIATTKALANFLVGESCQCEGTGFEFLIFCLRACIESPSLYQYQSTCFLFHALADSFRNVVALTRAGKAFLELSTHFRAAVENKPRCLDFQGIDWSTTDNASLQLWANAFSRGVDMVRTQDVCGLNAACAVIDIWKQSATLLIASNEHATFDSMRVAVSSAGALIAAGFGFLPIKLTPLVRPLMTSAQSERDEMCRLQTSLHMSRLLHLLLEGAGARKDTGYSKTFSKILQNLCNIIKLNEEPGCKTASMIIGSFANELPLSVAVTSLDFIWASLQPIADVALNHLDRTETTKSLYLLFALCSGLKQGSEMALHLITTFICPLVELRCQADDQTIRDTSSKVIKLICGVERSSVIETTLPKLAQFLKDQGHALYRRRGCYTLRDILEASSLSICPYVRTLLPLVMPLMTDPDDLCAKAAASMFARLVQVAPLVRESATIQMPFVDNQNNAELVMDHLIHGKKLPPCDLRPEISADLKAAGVNLRGYQLEGVTWLRFLQAVNLNGALCDSMGLGKTLQALVSVASSHLEANEGEVPVSLVVCPSSVVGHWVNEIKRFFSEVKVLRAVPVMGSTAQRERMLSSVSCDGNVVVTSYSTLRSDINKLAKIQWRYCILDEGHLLKNPKTATARASKQLKCRHKLVLSGTPVQNKVHEVWATFDFLMPNFLGSSRSFSAEFAKPITKSQAPGASASEIAAGIECLKALHQQVLPFILRREKEHVLKELPPKTISIIPCQMSVLQRQVYSDFCSSGQALASLRSLQKALESSDTSMPQLGKDVLRSLLFLRLLCTHPTLATAKHASTDRQHQSIEHSGKLVALNELLRDAGIQSQGLTAADNDSSLLYCDEDSDNEDEFGGALKTGLDESLMTTDHKHSAKDGSKCLIFAQFMHSLDIVENLLIKTHMPSVQYLRLDGRVRPEDRSGIVDMFNQDEDVKILLLTTRIGGLGLNLTGADMVIFLEHDWNPHADMQAMDRAHRIGQKKTVNVYKLVTTDSIEEKIMSMHDRKIAMSNAIVNTDNSSMFSLGTDRLLDIFRFRSEASNGSSTPDDMEKTLDSLVELYEDEYKSLSMESFVAGLRGPPIVDSSDKLTE